MSNGHDPATVLPTPPEPSALSNDLTLRALIAPAMSLREAKERHNAIVEFVAQVLVEGVDYGVIPGTDGKKNLLLPGAQKLSSFFGLVPTFHPSWVVRDFTGKDSGGSTLFFYEFECRLWRAGQLVGSALGSCSTWEKKYRWRFADRVCPACHEPQLRKSQYPPKGRPRSDPGGWWCDSRKGGCGAEFDHDDDRVTSQVIGLIENPEPFDLANTVLKMAQKRAFVGAVITALAAAQFFTQDLEYLDIEVEAGQVGTSIYVDPDTARDLAGLTLASEGVQRPSPPDPEAQRRLVELGQQARALRELERTVGLKPPAAGWQEADGEAGMRRVYQESRERLLAYLGTDGPSEAEREQATDQQLTTAVKRKHATTLLAKKSVQAVQGPGRNTVRGSTEHKQEKQ